MERLCFTSVDLVSIADETDGAVVGAECTLFSVPKLIVLLFLLLFVTWVVLLITAFGTVIRYL